MQPVFSPYPIFLEDDGTPLEAGYLYFGTPFLNPETNPIAVYWDAAGTQPAAQPIRTSGGYPMRNGNIGLLFTAGDYSIGVRDRNHQLVAYAQTSIVNAYSNSIVAFTAPYTGAILRTLQDRGLDVASALDFMTAAQKADVRNWVNVDVTDALNYAYKEEGLYVWHPGGIYQVQGDLDPPECSGIIGSGWRTGTSVEEGNYGTVFGFVTSVAGFPLPGANPNCKLIRDIAIFGTSVVNQVGIDIGHGVGAGSDTYNHGVIDNIRITGFNGVGSRPFVCGDMNFDRIGKILVDNCASGPLFTPRASGTSTVPADVVVNGLTVLSVTGVGLTVYSGSVKFNDLKIGSCGAQAIDISPGNGPYTPRTAEVIINGLSIENAQTAGAATDYAIRISSTAANGYALVTIGNMNHDGLCRTARVDGDTSILTINDGPYIGGTAPLAADVFWALNDAVINIPFWGRRAGFTVADTALTAISKQTGGVINSPSMYHVFTPVWDTPPTEGGGGAIVYSGMWMRVGDLVHVWFRSTASGGRTIASTGVAGGISFNGGTDDPPPGNPNSDFRYPGDFATSDGIAGAITGSAYVFNSGNIFHAYLPIIGATGADIFAHYVYRPISG